MRKGFDSAPGGLSDQSKDDRDSQPNLAGEIRAWSDRDGQGRTSLGLVGVVEPRRGSQGRAGGRSVGFLSHKLNRL